MDAGNALETHEALHGEDDARPYILESPAHAASTRPVVAKPGVEFSLDSVRECLDSDGINVLNQVVNTFLVPDSGAGLRGLLNELRTDLTELSKIGISPGWAKSLENLRARLSDEWGNDHVRDLGSLRSQRKSPLRSFLAPVDRNLSSKRHRAIRAVRGLLALRLLAGREQITTAMADELNRWLVSGGPESLSLEKIQPHHLRDLWLEYETDSSTSRLIGHLIQALEAKLDDPFKVHGTIGNVVAPAKQVTEDEREEADDNESKLPGAKPPADPLRGFLADIGNAGVRIFCGVPTYLCMQPYELVITTPLIIREWKSNHNDEGLAALLTLFTRVLPRQFSRIPLSNNNGAGIWIDLSTGCVCWNLDEVISSHHSVAPFQRSLNDRFVRIPLPQELVIDMRHRSSLANDPSSLDQLFQGDMDSLAIATKSMLRKLALTSHRPTLTRLSRTWGRYVLRSCHDEAYAAAIGIDFTLGTSANFNYFTIKGARLADILGKAYQSIGFDGRISDKSVEDIGSLWLPDVGSVSAFLTDAMAEASNQIRSLPKRAPNKKLFAAHNKVASRIYAVLKLLLGGRELTEETIARSRIDPLSGATVSTDKRTAPYHERRLAWLCPTLRNWLNTYLSWLQLIAYRLQSEDRGRSEKIAATIHIGLDGDVHPLFFRFGDDGEVTPLGADDLTPLYRDYGIKNNGGRHFLDWLFREAGLDSAAVMAWMGRGYPGQESFGSWSAAVPQDTLQTCADVIEKWLCTLSLAPAPNLLPRPLPFAPTKRKLALYIPRLLQSTPEWPDDHPSRRAEPCPFEDGTIARARNHETLFRYWRRHGPPPGWLGVALSLVIEDGVIHRDELDGILLELQTGTLYRHGRENFIDCVPAPLGIRRIWLSGTTIRLVHNMTEPRQTPVTVASLEKALDKFLARGLPDTKGRGFGFVLSCASACHSIQTPGVLYGWVRGFRFTRTTRPETVARHMTGCIEHPKFDTRRRRHHRPWHPQEKIKQALKKAARKAEGHKVHRSQIEWLCRYLEAILPDFEPSSEGYLKTHYLLHLCMSQQNVFTIIRYETGARQFLEKAADALANLGSSQVDWQLLVTSCLGKDDGSANDSPDRTAINHALTWLGIDLRTYRRQGPPPASLQYAELPSWREGVIAIGLLKAQQNNIGDDWHLASVALQLLFHDPHRWDGVANLRLCDLNLDGAHPHLVITYEAGADLKSGNAPRVLELLDNELVSELKLIREQRAARFPNDDLVRIFGDHDDPRTIRTAGRIHVLVGEALARATGSSVIRPHDPRGCEISRQIDSLLSPLTGTRHTLALEARQGMFRISVEAGQSAPDVTMENYAHHFDVHRRNWVTKINDDLNCPPSTEFLSRLTGISGATYRQRICRHGTSTFDLFEAFDPAVSPNTGATLIQLSSLVADGQNHIPWNPEFVGEDALTASALYLGLRMLGTSTSDSQLASKITAHAARRLDKGIAELNRRRTFSLSARRDINRDVFIDSLLGDGLAIAMTASLPHPATINRLVTSLSEIGDPWIFSNPEELLELKPWVSIWQANGIELEVNLKPGANASVDDFLLDRLIDIGIKRAKGSPARYFRKNVRASLKFLPKRRGGERGNARASPQLSFLVTVCGLSILLLAQGESA